ncbi:Tungsten-containing aldehyde ferredoxin oxidoreductase [[Clostridium] ultunense Esp]|uniref:Tungsten-containing aldehyde ferredoxin oxidoreductase n=1 Tax=[Clostridium] ultunense Esp TaxID=1288971 RepID=M1ZBU1_9FIRM|nr:aldehyde ferredoxin oxidoreductase family protein [Schnuerera ultunensis]CCQ95569.1 Tungsten-containing aldehyde ferredoxin oxidoreductase [[Clostridium] ultunense Esp]SHD78207.1 Tungsten-containing aldehyde ferredoxin oxidoreductase [[Clostridium] ultunense Esp]
MSGYMGKILRVNLTDRTVKVEPLDLKVAQKYLGSRGLGVKIMVDEVPANVDPFSEENKIIIATGALTGAPVPTSGRYMVISKSPLTGTIAIANSGGYWGPKFKATGHDAIIFEGKADKPVYLYIEDDKIEIRDASHIWGKTVSEATEIIKGDHEGVNVLSIGPAGENLSLMASIMNDLDRAAGRGGIGAVMGSKNLKAVVVRGSKKVSLFDEERVKKVSSEKIRILREDPVAGGGLPSYGSAVLVNIINESGVLPVRNFQKSYTDNADLISGETMTEKHLVKKQACFRCPIACGRVVKLADGSVVGGPEYETVWSYGADCDVYDYDAINEANMLCNDYGLDTISAGATIAAAMELYEKGYIKDEDIEKDGLSLNWGDAKAIVGWTKKMALREGFGDKLTDGSYRLAESYGVPELSMSVKKQELPAYDPRGVQGHGITYAVNNRGGCHIKGYMISPEILGYPEKLDRLSLEGKAAYAKVFHDLTAVIDSIGLCVFSTFGLGLPDYVDMYNAVCGDIYDDDSLLEAGERVWNLEKLFNLREGIDSSHDTLPKRLLEEPVVNGPTEGHIHHLDKLLPEYYEVRGWDEKGIPTEETLERLGLEEYKKYLGLASK